MSSQQSIPRTGFLDLPYEIRHSIYQLLFCDSIVHLEAPTDLSSYQDGEAIGTKTCILYSPDRVFSLLLSCRQVYLEGQSKKTTGVSTVKHC